MGLVFKMLEKLNVLLGKWMPILTPISVLCGVLASIYLQPLAFLVPWIFAFMTFAGSLNSSFQSFKHTVSHPLPILLALLVLHIVIPLWAWSIGNLFFHNDPLIITGLILAVSIPTGITSIIWVTMYNGSNPLAISIILIDTILSPLIVPASMSLLVGETVAMNGYDLMQGLFIMVVVPSILGMTFNRFMKPASLKKMSSRISPLSKLSLPIVIAINSSAIAPYVRSIDIEFLKITIAMLFIAICGYLFSWLIGFIYKRKKSEIVSLVFTGGMRNISAGAVLAVSFFPAKVAMPVIVCMLFQQLLAATVGHALSNYYIKKESISL